MAILLMDLCNVFSGNPACPVTSFRKYVSKLHPDNTALWQRPLDTFDDESAIWYANSPLGVHSIGGFMKQISKMAKLAHTYTNHSVRATHITILDEAGHEARHIMRTTGHKNEASIRSYSHRLSDKKKRDISSTIAASIVLADEPNQATINQPMHGTSGNHVPQPAPNRPVASTSRPRVHQPALYQPTVNRPGPSTSRSSVHQPALYQPTVNQPGPSTSRASVHQPALYQPTVHRPGPSTPRSHQSARPGHNIYDVGQCSSQSDSDTDISDGDLMSMDLTNMPINIHTNERAVATNSMSTSRSFCPSFSHCSGVTFNFYGGGFNPNN